MPSLSAFSYRNIKTAFSYKQNKTDYFKPYEAFCALSTYWKIVEYFSSVSTYLLRFTGNLREDYTPVVTHVRKQSTNKKMKKIRPNGKYILLIYLYPVFIIL